VGGMLRRRRDGMSERGGRLWVPEAWSEGHKGRVTRSARQTKHLTFGEFFFTSTDVIAGLPSDAVCLLVHNDAQEHDRCCAAKEA